ncbi:nitrate reductase gamma subunit [Nocardia transvalensis]|uniref:Nitrate reductase gamma subunit n=1 Tax=Nocardia transvalensis TaxID=37333 RepID=A0A7W9PAQ5_9NOCA|nr:respiratory nitrate reductase subunit gamma [Nocardia transvalensis]MBB5912531.1 nitrate reductase gamma subunit [Nocardia transvalensis]
MTVLLWIVLPYCAFVSFVVGNLWRYRHDRFRPESCGPDADRVERYGAFAFRLGAGLLLSVRVTDVIASGPSHHPPGPLAALMAVVEVIALPTAAAGAVLLFLPTMLAGTRRAPVTPVDRVTLPLLIAIVLSGVAVRFDPNPADDHYMAAATLFAWARSLFSAHPSAEFMTGAAAPYQIRGLSLVILLGIWPYTRLAGIFAGPVVRWTSRRRVVLTPRLASEPFPCRSR